MMLWENENFAFIFYLAYHWIHTYVYVSGARAFNLRNWKFSHAKLFRDFSSDTHSHTLIIYSPTIRTKLTATITLYQYKFLEAFAQSENIKKEVTGKGAQLNLDLVFHVPLCNTWLLQHIYIPTNSHSPTKIVFPYFAYRIRAQIPTQCYPLSTPTQQREIFNLH